jgi:hypothetical protein
LVLDSPAAHEAKLIRHWLAKRPRHHVHLTPTSASWIDQVERWFGLLAGRALRRRVPRSVADLERAIRTFIDAPSAEPKPFRRAKAADDTLASVRRFCPHTPGASTADDALARISESGQ